MLGLFGDVFSGFFRGFSTTGVSLNFEAINLLHHIRLLCSHDRLQEALKLFYSITPPPPLVHSHHTYAALFHPCARRSSLPMAKLSTATCFYTTPTLISTSIWVIMLLTCMSNVGHWIMPTNCLMKCRTGILFPGLLSFLGMPSMVGLMSVLGSLGTCWFGTGQRSLRLPAWLALVVGTAIVDGR